MYINVRFVLDFVLDLVFHCRYMHYFIRNWFRRCNVQKRAQYRSWLQIQMSEIQWNSKNANHFFTDFLMVTLFIFTQNLKKKLCLLCLCGNYYAIYVGTDLLDLEKCNWYFIKQEHIGVFSFYKNLLWPGKRYRLVPPNNSKMLSKPKSYYIAQKINEGKYFADFCLDFCFIITKQNSEKKIRNIIL